MARIVRVRSDRGSESQKRLYLPFTQAIAMAMVFAPGRRPSAPGRRDHPGYYVCHHGAVVQEGTDLVRTLRREEYRIGAAGQRLRRSRAGRRRRAPCQPGQSLYGPGHCENWYPERTTRAPRSRAKAMLWSRNCSAMPRRRYSGSTRIPSSQICPGASNGIMLRATTLPASSPTMSWPCSSSSQFIPRLGDIITPFPVWAHMRSMAGRSPGRAGRMIIAVSMVYQVRWKVTYQQ